MADQDDVHLTRTEARGGSSNHMTRYVLPISLALIVIFFIVLLTVWH